MDDDIMGAVERYHTASANLRFLKQTRQAYAVNYDPQIIERVRSAQLDVEPVRPAISVPIDSESASMPLCRAIQTRSSARGFAKRAMPLAKLGPLLYLANGVRTDQRAEQGIVHHRNVANSGNLGSVEIYCFALNIEGVEPGIYHFDSVDHQLLCLECADYSTWLRECAILQGEFADAAVLLVLTSSLSRLAPKYGLRAYRLALMDVGHVSQNIYLAATALGLDVCATAGFIDCDLNLALKLDGLDRCAQLVLGVS